MSSTYCTGDDNNLFWHQLKYKWLLENIYLRSIKYHKDNMKTHNLCRYHMTTQLLNILFRKKISCMPIFNLHLESTSHKEHSFTYYIHPAIHNHISSWSGISGSSQSQDIEPLSTYASCDKQLPYHGMNDPPSLKHKSVSFVRRRTWHYYCTCTYYIIIRWLILRRWNISSI